MREYWKKQLNLEVQKCYDLIKIGLENKKYQIKCNGHTPKDIEEAYIAVINDYPDIYNVDFTVKISSMVTGFFTVNTLILSTIYDENEMRLHKIYINNIKRELSNKLNNISDEKEKIIVIAEFIAKNTKYEINNKFNQNAISALYYKKAQCSGVSRAFKFLMDCFNLSSIIVEGQVIQNGVYTPHAWNIVKINNKFYHIDVTSLLNSSCSIYELDKYHLLFKSDELISESHNWDKSKTPDCNANANEDNFFNNEKTIKINSISEFRYKLKECLINDKNDLLVEYNSDMDNQKQLIKVISNAVRMVCQQLKINKTYRITILGLTRIKITFLKEINVNK